MKSNSIRIGTAGWSLPSFTRNDFPLGKSILERYSQVFNFVEINSSFYKSHRKTTYERWAASTPSEFLFAVKMPKQITHVKKLVGIENLLDIFLNEISGLQNKLGPMLVQLPPSLKFELTVAKSFFAILRGKFDGIVVLEPRHISWAQLEANLILEENHIERVIADPVIVPSNSKQMFRYYRLHGSPEIYTSSYDAEFLDQLAKSLSCPSWLIFDNTKIGAATQNALELNKITAEPYL